MDADAGREALATPKEVGAAARRREANCDGGPPDAAAHGHVRGNGMRGVKGRRPSAVVRERVLGRLDLALFAALTLGIAAAAMGVLVHWASQPDWRRHPVILATLTVLALPPLAIRGFRWSLLPGMRRPLPMPAPAGLSVGVATSFVPGVEPLDMLERTVQALVAMDYPHETWVLDEGDDAGVAALCRRLGARHFSRRHRPEYQRDDGVFQARCKHGNYNAWLHEVGLDRYDFVAAFDPDHVPDRSFLASVLGYFDDPAVGYVQAPQIYHNTGSNLIARGSAEEVAPFYSVVQMASDSAGHPIIVGCHNTHRTSALREVGGLAPHQADDIMLTMLYRSRGWHGVYVPTVLASGLAPVDWGTYLRQQGRWARAMLDLKFRVYPRLARSLPLGSRILGLLHGASFLQGAFSLFALILVVLYALAFAVDLRPFDGPLLAWVGGLAVALMLAEGYQSRFYLQPPRRVEVRWRAAVLGFAKWPFFLWALVEVASNRRRPYATTPKHRVRSGRVSALWPHAITILAVCGAWAVGRLLAEGAASPVVLATGALLILSSASLIAIERLAARESRPAPN